MESNFRIMVWNNTSEGWRYLHDEDGDVLELKTKEQAQAIIENIGLKYISINVKDFKIVKEFAFDTFETKLKDLFVKSNLKSIRMGFDASGKFYKEINYKEDTK